MSAGTSPIAVAIQRVRLQIAEAATRSGRSAADVCLIAVTKTVEAAPIQEAYAAGIRHFGENRVQEWEGKRSLVGELTGAAFHMIGHLQRNKARRAVAIFDRVDSLDNPSLARKLDQFAAEAGRVLPVLIEVHLSQEPAKTGVEPQALPALAKTVAQSANLQLLGLMTIPPWDDDPEAARPYFRRLRELRDDVARRLGRPLPALSMGMSHDFEVAIEEGATEVRIGTAIFGERPQPAAGDG